MEFEGREVVAHYEGGTIAIAESSGRPVVIINEAALISLLSEEDAAGMPGEKVVLFETPEERTKFLLERYRIDLERTSERAGW